MKEQKGVTLIALVISIIVILILASVSLRTLTGDNGIITRAKDTKTLQTVAVEKEEVKLAYVSASMKKNEADLTVEDIQKELNSKLGENKVEVTSKRSGQLFVVEFKETQNIYSIEHGTVTKGDNSTEMTDWDKIYTYFYGKDVVSLMSLFNPNSYEFKDDESIGIYNMKYCGLTNGGRI